MKEIEKLSTRNKRGGFGKREREREKDREEKKKKASGRVVEGVDSTTTRVG